ncbi:hypothetical protein DMENIID0001_128510 [Sergentomyia squamirostris]
MVWRFLVCLLYLVTVVLAKPTVETLTVRVPGMGPIIGTTSQTAWSHSIIYQFMGIKYAESPVGELRFKAPVPKAAWTELVDTTQPGRPCPDFAILAHSPDSIGPEFEDCLSLSVYTKNLSANSPVLAFVHGGAFVTGAGYQHPPQYLLEQDIVLVVIQYRLGPLGFLSMKTDNIPGNAALLDVILGLQWVQTHVRSFGGDPTKVTLAGHSAGAALVNALAYSPSVEEHLFQQTIIQSGGAMATWVWDDNPVRNAREIAIKSGCPYNSTDTEFEDCLQEINLFFLIAGFGNHMNAGSPGGLNTVGGHRITIGGPTNLYPANPYDIMNAGGGRRDLRMLVGAAKNEGTFSLIGTYDILNSTIGLNDHHFNTFRLIDIANRIIGVDEPTSTLTGFLSKALWTQEQLNSGKFEELMDGLVDHNGVTVIKGPVLRAAQGNAFFKPNGTFLYSFDYLGEHTRFGYGADVSGYPFEGGVTHSDPEMYIFPYPPEIAQLNEEDMRIARIMVDLWGSFVRDGVPTSAEVTTWPPMTNLSGPYLHINQNSTIGEDYYDEYSVTAREGIPSRNNSV